jgi:hypothetical protein
MSLPREVIGEAHKIVANPANYTAEQRRLAWLVVYQHRTGTPVRQSTLPKATQVEEQNK